MQLSQPESATLPAVALRADRATRRLTWNQARDQGKTITDACKLAGVTLMTGTRWNKQRAAELQGGTGQLRITNRELVSRILSKQEVGIYISSAIVRAYAGGQYAYLSSLAARLCEMMGYDAPTEHVVHDAAREKIADWLVRCLDERAGRTQAIDTTALEANSPITNIMSTPVSCAETEVSKAEAMTGPGDPPK